MILQETRVRTSSGHVPDTVGAIEQKEYSEEKHLNLIEGKQSYALFMLGEGKLVFEYPTLPDVFSYVYGNISKVDQKRLEHNFIRTSVKIYKILTGNQEGLSPDAADFVDWMRGQEIYRDLSKAELAQVMNRKEITPAQLWDRVRILKEKQKENGHVAQEIVRENPEPRELPIEPAVHLPSFIPATENVSLETSNSALVLDQYGVYRLASLFLDKDRMSQFGVTIGKDNLFVINMLHWHALNTLTGIPENGGNLKEVLAWLARDPEKVISANANHPAGLFLLPLAKDIFSRSIKDNPIF